MKLSRLERVETFIIKTLISDHFSIFASLQLKEKCIARKQSLKINDKIVDRLIQQTSWNHFQEMKNAEEIYNELCFLLNSIYDNAASNSIQSKRKQKIWITREIVDLCKRRDRLYRSCKRTPNDQEKRKVFNTFRNFVNKKIIFAKNAFYKSRFQLVKKM